MEEKSVHNEKELLSQLLQGSERAFEKIYKIYSLRLYTSLLKLVKSPSDAQEILQDVFIKIWENRQNIDPEKSFRSYLFRIAENKAYDFFRSTARDKIKMERLIEQALIDGQYLVEKTNKTDYTIVLEKAIALLPLQRQRVYRLCKLEGKSYKEVNELLGISISTISDHVVKANKTIRDYFEHNEQALVALIMVGFISGI